MTFFSDEALQVLADGLMSARERSNKLSIMPIANTEITSERNMHSMASVEGY